MPKKPAKDYKNSGLPIGNLTSQFFANLYLNQFDQYVKHKLKCKYYLRYCDDFILLSKDPGQLLEFKALIIDFLRINLKLELNSNYGDVKQASNGIDFLGYVTRHKYQLVRSRVLTNLNERLKHFKSILVKDLADNKVIYHYDITILEKLRATLASYWGHFIYADSFKLRLNILKRNGWLDKYFELSSQLLISKSPKFIPKYQTPKLWNKVSEQYNYYLEKYKNKIVLFEVGQYIEFYNLLNADILELFKLKQLKPNKRRVLYGFPKQLIHKYKASLEEAELSWVIICETGRMICGIKERLAYSELVYL